MSAEAVGSAAVGAPAPATNGAGAAPPPAAAPAGKSTRAKPGELIDAQRDGALDALMEPGPGSSSEAADGGEWPFPDGADEADPNALVEDDTGGEEAELGEDAPIAGLAPRDLLEKLRAGELPEELASQIRRTFKVGDEMVTMTLPEMERAAMRGRDYQNKTAKLAEARRQAEGTVARETAQWERWQDPRALVADFQARGLLDVMGESGVLFDAARLIAEQTRAKRQMTPEQRRAHEIEQRAARKEAEIAQREQKLNESERGQRVQRYQAEIGRQIGEHSPAAFAHYGIQVSKDAQTGEMVPSKLASQVFNDALSRIARAQDRFDGITREMVWDAAEYTRDALIEMHRMGTGGQAPAPAAQGTPAARQRPRGGAPPPTALPGAAQAGAPAQKRVERYKPSDFMAAMQQRARGR